jgi:hypothetical protein
MRSRTEQVLAQPRGPRAVQCAAALAVGVIFVYKGLGQPLSYQYVAWTLGVASAMWAWRLWNVRVVLDRDVTIENVVRFIGLPWSEIERFELDRHGGVRVRRRDQRTHRITAFGRPPRRDPFGWRENNQRAVVALQAALEARRTSSTS